MTHHKRQARLNYASGNSCEQALYAAFADVLNLSLVGALQEAPKKKDRGCLCGAYRSGVQILTTLQEKMRASQPPVKTGRRKDMKETETEHLDDAVAEFKRLFIEENGSTKCEYIMRNQKGSDCLELIGWTACLVDRVIEEFKES